MRYDAIEPQYRAAGWPSLLPLPEGKKAPVPEGFTGKNGCLPTDADGVAWAGRAGNFGLRLPSNVIGVDVDDYEVVKNDGTVVVKTGAPPSPASSSNTESSRQRGAQRREEPRTHPA